MWGVIVCALMSYFGIYMIWRSVRAHNVELIIFWAFFALVWLYLTAIAVFGLFTYGL